MLLHLFVALQLFGSLALAQNCRQRREWRQLSRQEKDAFLSAVNRLKQRPMAGTNAPPNTISYDDLTKLHWDMADEVHGYSSQ